MKTQKIPLRKPAQTRPGYNPASSRRMVVAVAIASLSLAVSTHAASDSWVGLTDSTWATPANWLTNTTVPGAGETATFNGAGNGNTIIDLGAGVTLGTLVLDTSSAAAYTIGSGAVGSQTLTLGTLAGGIQMNSTVTQNQLINANLALSTTGIYTIGLTNNSLTNTLTVAGGISASTTGAKTLTVTGNGNTTVSGAITNGTGTMNLTKTGTGTLTLSGTSTYSGGTRANAGTTVISGTRAKQAGTGDWFSVNNVGAQNATVKIVSGANWGIQDFNIGETANTRAAVFQTGGTFTAANGVKIGNGGTSYAYYSLSSGTLNNTAGDFSVGNGSGATGVMDVTGGSVTAGSWIVVGRGATTSSGLLNVTGGSVTSNSNNIALNWAATAGAVSILNVGGGAGAASITGASGAANYFDVVQSNTAGTLGVANLLTNGTLTVAAVKGTTVNGTGLFNFNGGTLKATATNQGANFMTSANIDAVTVYSGGGTIDNNSTNITIGRPLAAATGNGITSIAVTDGGSGYIGAPMVKVSGGTGNTATGYAVMVDDGTGNGTFKVDTIVITSGGTYTVDPTTVTLVGGGATTAATIGAITTAANTSGGMTFSGSGTTTLTAANTYTGATTITSGTLVLSATGSTGSTSIGFGVADASNGLLTANNAAFSFSGSLDFAIGGVTLSSQTWTLFNGTGFDASKLTISGITSDIGSLTFSDIGAGNWQGTDGSSRTWTFSSDLGTLNVVPEPSTWALLAFSLTTVMVLRRRRQS